MTLQFHPPTFLRPLEYEGISNLPRGLDEIIDANLRRKAMQDQRQLLGLQIQGARSDQAFNQFQRRTALGGLDPSTITEDQYQAAMRQPTAGPFATSAPQTGLPQAQPMGPTSSVPSQLSNLAPSTDIPESVNVSKLRELFQMRKQSTALESLEKMTRTRKEAAQTGLYEAQAEALRRGDIYFDPVSGSQMAVPHGAKPLPRPDRPVTTEYAARTYVDKAKQADAVLADLVRGGFNPASIATGLGNLAPNIMKPEDVQRSEQAKLQFVAAVLRKESGAAVTESEARNYGKQFWPEVGDASETLAQKAASRRLEIEKLEAEAKRVPGARFGPPTQQRLAPAKAAPAAAPGSDAAIRIREDFRAGRITREQAHQMLRGIRQ